MKTSTLPLLAGCLAAVTLPALAADWPQWRGPDRTDVSKETGLLSDWPPNGPKLLWTCTEAGTGFSGPAVVGDRLYSMGADDKHEFVFAADVKSGKKLWSAEVGEFYSNDWGSGPRATPTVDGDRLYTMGGQGDLVCVETASGKKLWGKSLTNDLHGGLPRWGYTESPLVDGDKVVCTPGGDRGTIAALKKTTGEIVWQSKEYKDGANYASLIPTTLNGVRQYVQMTGESVASVAADDGRLLWRFKRSGPTAAVPTPVVHDNLVYATSGYGAGCHLIKLTPAGGGFRAEQVYASGNMTNHHGGVVLVGDHLYGYSDGKGWVCQKLADGKVVWSEKEALGKGSLTCAGGRLYCYSEEGTVVLAEASPAGWKEHGRFELPQKTKLERQYDPNIWTHPVVANGRLYLRDQDLILCFDVRAR
jgi:outer membrane protein assembly factor BamB